MTSSRVVLRVAFLLSFTCLGLIPVIAQEQQTVQEVVEQADALLEAGDFGGAADLYVKVLQAQPSYVPAAIAHAKCLDALGESQLALGTATDAVAQAARHPKLRVEALTLQAKLLIENGKYQEAVDGMEQAILQNPANADLLLLRASAFRELVNSRPTADHPEEDQKYLLFALKSMNRAAKLKNSKLTSQKILFERGLIKVALGRNDEALDDIQASLEEAELDPSFAKMIARQLTSKKQTLRQASKANPASKK